MKKTNLLAAASRGQALDERRVFRGSQTLLRSGEQVALPTGIGFSRRGGQHEVASFSLYSPNTASSDVLVMSPSNRITARPLCCSTFVFVGATISIH